MWLEYCRPWTNEYVSNDPRKKDGFWLPFFQNHWTKSFWWSLLERWICFQQPTVNNACKKHRFRLFPFQNIWMANSWRISPKRWVLSMNVWGGAWRRGSMTRCSKNVITTASNSLWSILTKQDGVSHQFSEQVCHFQRATWWTSDPLQ